MNVLRVLIFMAVACIAAISACASPPWLGVNSFHPWDGEEAHALLYRLDPHWGRVGLDTKPMALSNDWTFADALMDANRRVRVILCLKTIPLDEPTVQKVLDRYGTRIAIVEAVNEPPDYATLTNAIVAWTRVLEGRKYRPPLAAPSNQNTTETLQTCMRLKDDGLLSACNYIAAHEYLGRSGNGNWPIPPDGNNYVHPDQDYGGLGDAYQRYMNIQTATGKELLITEFTFEPTDVRDAALWAEAFSKAHVKAVLLHWPQNIMNTTLSGMLNKDNRTWNAAMMRFLSTAEILSGKP